MANINLAVVGNNLVKSAETGETVELKGLWQDQPVVLFFLRRFGCQVCRWMASEISKLEPDLTASGVSLVGIGPEELGLKEFKEGGFFKGSLYVDEKKKSYKDLGFKRYSALSVVPAALGKKVRDVITKANAVGIQGNFSGDLLQSGGMLIVAKGGESILLHFVQDSPGDHVPLEDISKALGISAQVKAGQMPVPTDPEEVIKAMVIGILLVVEDVNEPLPSSVLQRSFHCHEEEDCHLSDVPNTLVNLMGLLYTVNLDYPKHLKYTFEVIQRLFMGILSEMCSPSVHSLKNKLLNIY